MKKLHETNPNHCKVNERNFEYYIDLLVNDTFRLTDCLRKGTNLKSIINTLNLYNAIIIEIKKVLSSIGPELLLESDSIGMGEPTYDFGIVTPETFDIRSILEFLHILRDKLLCLKAIYHNILVPNRYEMLIKKETENAIMNAVYSIFKQKHYITLPARSQRIVSIFLESNLQQICFLEK